MNILIIGAGSISIEYAKVIDALNVKYVIFQRSSSNKKVPDNLNLIKRDSIKDLDLNEFTHIINCVDLENQAKVNFFLLQNSNAKILSEKPGFIFEADYLKALNLSKEIKSNFFVAYNRRFFQSVIKLKELSELDGGITSMHFEFTEWQKSVEETNISMKLKEKWALLNSSHVIDLAFFICGNPKDINCETFAALDWHPRSAIMKGYGVTFLGIPFSFSSDWSSAGRWEINIFTKRRKFILSPLEKLKYIEKETVLIKDFEMSNDNFKHGFYKQIDSFLFNNAKNIPSLENAYYLNKIVTKICGYE